jgi:hypothetical protein
MNEWMNEWTQNKSASLIDNIFIDYTQSGKYLVYPSINGLSDHDAQLLIIKIFVCRCINFN